MNSTFLLTRELPYLYIYIYYGFSWSPIRFRDCQVQALQLHMEDTSAPSDSRVPYYQCHQTWRENHRTIAGGFSSKPRLREEVFYLINYI